jgi:hypothetical protein
MVNRVSIYRWQDSVPSQVRKRTDPHEILLVPGQSQTPGEWYECIGMFAGTLKVQVGIDRVTAIDRLNDRSQLAQVRSYSAKAALHGYLNASYELAEPDSICIDFAHGMPENLAESPYPEKIVIAYHKTFSQDPGYGRIYLTTSAQNQPGSGGAWRTFGPSTRDVCVKRISYGPAAETESEMQSFGTTDGEVTAGAEVQLTPSAQAFPQGVSPIRARVQTRATYKLPGINEPQTIQIEWSLVRETRPAGQQEVWKIDSIREME